MTDLTFVLNNEVFSINWGIIVNIFITAAALLR